MQTHTHRRVWPKVQSEKARAAAREAGGEEALGGSTDAKKTKQQIRGGKTVDFLESDPGGKKIEKLLCLNSGTQDYLNGSFAASKAVTEYINMLARVPAQSENSTTDCEQRVKRQECIQKNLKYTSGEVGMDVLAAYPPF